MPCSLEPLTASYSSYTEYVSDLREHDEAFDQLLQFFTKPHDDSLFNHGKHPKEWNRSQAHLSMCASAGSLSVIDIVQDSLEIQNFVVPSLQPCVDRLGILRALDSRPIGSKARIIFIDYFRCWVDGVFIGIDREVLDKIALQYRLHPEILRLHFGSNRGLDESGEINIDVPDYYDSPCATSQYLQLKYVHGFLSAHLHGDCTCSNSMTVVILARNEELDRPLMASGLSFLDDSFPTILKPTTRTQQCWTNDAYLQRLQSFPSAAIISATQNLVEFLIPYGNIVATTESYLMAFWKSKVGERTRNADDFDFADGFLRRVPEQDATLRAMQENLQEFQRHAPQTPSQRYTTVLRILEKVVSQGEDQVQRLRSEMNSRSAVASLRESKLAIQVSEQGIAQNERVKILTQLAFIFIPLSAVASIFGMNLDVLDSGTAKIWMFIVGTIIAYVMVLSLWGVYYSMLEGALVRWMNIGQNKWQSIRKPNADPAQLDDPA